MRQLLLAVLIVAVSTPVLRREASRHRDVRLLWLLVAALAFRMCATFGRDFVDFKLYGGAADVSLYHQWALEWAARFGTGHFALAGHFPTGPYFIGLVTGAIYAVIGPDRQGAALVFSWMGFWGLFCFYRAFVLTFPQARRRQYAALLFFLPSITFWTAGIGKDAWTLFALGVLALGAAELLSGRWRGIVLVAAGLLGSAVVRPQIAAMGAVAFAASSVVRRSRSRKRRLTPLVKVVSVAGAAVVAWVAVSSAIHYLQSSGVETGKGVAAALEEASKKGQFGGSEFRPFIPTSPVLIVPAAVTVLYRPFIFEAGNVQAVAAAAEGSFLLYLTFARSRRIRAGLRRIRHTPYVAFALVYSGLAIFAFSSIANFGLLVRQRVQLLPFMLVLLCVPPVRSPAPPPAPARRPAGRRPAPRPLAASDRFGR